jgi:hypothetical protein
MKRILFLTFLILALVGIIYANDLVIYTYAISDSDTGTVRSDTVVTPSVYLGDRSHLRFYSVLSAYAVSGAIDTNWADDSFLVYLQFSPDDKTWNVGDTFALDTFTDNSSGWSWLHLDRDTSNAGNYIRFKMVHRDSIGSGEVDSAWLADHTSFYKQLKVWITGY